MIAPTRIEILVPALPCPCAPALADSKVLALMGEAEKLRRGAGPDVVVQVWGLNADLARIRTHPAMADLLHEQGHGALPAVFVNGRLVSTAEWPDAALLTAMLAAG